MSRPLPWNCSLVFDKAVRKGRRFQLRQIAKLVLLHGNLSRLQCIELARVKPN